MTQLPAGAWEALLAIDDVEEAGSGFKDAPALWVNGAEIAHLDADGTVDIRLTREVIRAQRAELRADPRVRLRPSSSSDWLRFQVGTSADVAQLVTLVQRAVDAHRVFPGRTAAPPPSPQELARRRQLHG